MKVIHLQGLDASAIEAAAAAASAGESGSSGASAEDEAPLSPVLLRGTITKHHLLRTAYFQQHQQECLPYDQSPLDYLSSVAPDYVREAGAGHGGLEQQIRAHLGSFGLSGALALQLIGKLSGGQKARVVLAELTLHRCGTHISPTAPYTRSTSRSPFRH